MLLTIRLDDDLPHERAQALRVLLGDVVFSRLLLSQGKVTIDAVPGDEPVAPRKELLQAPVPHGLVRQAEWIERHYQTGLASFCAAAQALTHNERNDLVRYFGDTPRPGGPSQSIAMLRTALENRRSTPDAAS